MSAPAETCPWCGEDAEMDVLECWAGGHEFQIASCCAASLEDFCDGALDDPRWGRARLAAMGLPAALAGHGALRGVADDGCGALLLDFRPEVRPVGLAAARAFVAANHAHGPAFGAAARFQLAAWNGPTLCAVAVVGNPVAPALARRGDVWEVTRLCVRRDGRGAALGRHCASKLYAACAREARRRGLARLVTYTRADDEDGKSLIAAGWAVEARVRGRSWHGGARRPRRVANPEHAWADKLRWGRALRKPGGPAALSAAAR